MLIIVMSCAPPVCAGLGGGDAGDEEGRQSTHCHPTQPSLWIQGSPQPCPVQQHSYF